MPYSCLPTWPLILFGIIEPALLTWAYIVAITDPFRIFSSQAPNFPITEDLFPPQALGLTLQFGNILLMLAPMALICSWTTHPEVAKWYLFSVALADLGHIYATYRAVGAEYFWDFAGWNDMVWGNVGVSGFLHVNRLATLVGLFGEVKAGVEGRKEK